MKGLAIFMAEPRRDPIWSPSGILLLACPAQLSRTRNWPVAFRVNEIGYGFDCPTIMPQIGDPCQSCTRSDFDSQSAFSFSLFVIIDVFLLHALAFFDGERSFSALHFPEC